VRTWQPLARSWIVTALLELAAFGLGWLLNGAIDEMLKPVYVVALLPGLWGTWRWIRPRGARDRRAGDRRHASRRGSPPSP
jgi:hypothetical protein